MRPITQVPWNGDYVAAPDLTAGSVLMYDSVGLAHRPGNHTPNDPNVFSLTPSKKATPFPLTPPPLAD